MNRKLKTFLLEKGFSIERNIARGQIEGFDVVVRYNIFNSKTPISIFISCYNTINKKVEFYSKMYEKRIRYTTYSYNDLGVFIGTNGVTMGSCIDNLPALLDSVFITLKEMGFKGAGICPFCGEVLERQETYKLPNYCNFVEIHNSCRNIINDDIKQENEEIDKIPNNYLKGFCGALIGSLVGAAVMILLYLANFIASISSLIAFILGITLYKKFGGKESKTMVLIVSLTSMFVLMLSFFGVNYVITNMACTKNNIGYSGFDAFKYYLSFNEYKKAFIRDALLQLLFWVIGMGINVFALLKKVKRVQAI